MSEDESMDVLERVAMAIADANGDAWEDVPLAKWHWNEQRGEFGGHFRDINMPMRQDYLNMAAAALTAVREIRRGMAPLPATRDMEASNG